MTFNCPDCETEIFESDDECPVCGKQVRKYDEEDEEC